MIVKGIDLRTFRDFDSAVSDGLAKSLECCNLVPFFYMRKHARYEAVLFFLQKAQANVSQSYADFIYSEWKWTK